MGDPGSIVGVHGKVAQVVPSSRSSAPWCYDLRNVLFHPLPPGRGCTGEFAPVRTRPVETAYPRAQRCSLVKFCSRPHSRATAIALFPFRNPMIEATAYFGGIDAHVHMVRLQMSFDDLTFLLPGQSMENFPQLPADFPENNLPPSLGDEHNMVFTVPLRMG